MQNKKIINMKYNSNLESAELSYFRLSLLSFLKESHPNKVTDSKFIATRGDIAAEAYSEAIKSGLDHIQASEIANQTLFEGLHFSLYRTLVTILWEVFSKEIDPDKAESVALILLSHFDDIVAKYTLSDDFSDIPEYNLLYTELTGAIQIFLEDGLQ